MAGEDGEPIGVWEWPECTNVSLKRGVVRCTVTEIATLSKHPATDITIPMLPYLLHWPFFLDYLVLENDGTKYLQNFAKHSPTEYKCHIPEDLKQTAT
jgi:hypothetical protein